MTLLVNTLQGSRHWFDMILAPEYPLVWGNTFLLADLYALSLHGPSGNVNRENMNRQLTADFFSPEAANGGDLKRKMLLKFT